MEISSTVSVSLLPLPPHQRQKLLTNGFNTVVDLWRTTPIELSKETQLTHEEALTILRLVDSRHGDGVLSVGKSAAVLLNEERVRLPIVTFCSELDALLGGGVATAEITEFCGVPGVGKTQLAMQLSVDIQLPELFGGLAGEAVYVDTEGSFMVERCLNLADAAVKHVQALGRSQGSDEAATAAAAFTRDSIMDGIHYFRACDVSEQISVIETLAEYVRKHPRIKLVVFDSIAFHFRQDFADMAARTRLLGQISQELMRVANTYEIAVVTVNQVTTKIAEFQTQGCKTGRTTKSKLVPALGDTFSHTCTTRVILFWKDSRRFAHLFKSPRLCQQTCPFSITIDGIRSARANVTVTL